MTILGNARIRLGWVKALIGQKGNEIADTLTKEETTDGIPANLPFPKSYLKNELLQPSLLRCLSDPRPPPSPISTVNYEPQVSTHATSMVRQSKQSDGHWNRLDIQPSAPLYANSDRFLFPRMPV
ncbi:hypothetical protein AVEN_71540-1 [Araneus ventricosus]|uniref:RNase H type-1 domain-containing protein n=1 Tax=Araneus ventricosus TaxID=182803 RepID=A0A4Y2PHB0_ARAVE|nr:hypothetical protein AVEN_71540-1 [Araneus ventricosus]